jgi:hypothetical protein
MLKTTKPLEDSIQNRVVTPVPNGVVVINHTAIGISPSYTVPEDGMIVFNGTVMAATVAAIGLYVNGVSLTSVSPGYNIRTVFPWPVRKGDVVYYTVALNALTVGFVQFHKGR